MARRKAPFDALLGFLIVGAIAFALLQSAANFITRAFPEVTLPLFLLIVAAGIAVFVMLRALHRRHRRRVIERANREAVKQRYMALLAKYGDSGVVEQIMLGGIWHDMSKEQLIDAWGYPDEIETKVLKTKIREIYKFGRTGVNRFSKRATLENDVVVGWELK